MYNVPMITRWLVMCMHPKIIDYEKKSQQQYGHTTITRVYIQYTNDYNDTIMGLYKTKHPGE